jgi:hypothetical protein
MLPYWIAFLIPVVSVYLSKQATSKNRPRLNLYGLFLILFIGLRHQVGGDWFSYLEGLDAVKYTPIDEIFSARMDIGYYLVNKFSLAIGFDIYGVNLICAAIFTIGLLSLSRNQPYPWLAIVVSMPYFVTVVAMGYTRQATAIGLLMFGFIYLLQGRTKSYLLIVLMAASFHKTAIVFAVFLLFRPGRSNLIYFLGVVLLLISTVGAILADEAEFLIRHYVEQNMESAGGPIRVIMNIPPAIILFIFWKKWGIIYNDRWLWGLVAILALLCVPAVFVASTSIDRMALYLIPLQLVVWARLPVLLQNRLSRNWIFLMVVVYYSIVLNVWLVYGNWSSLWIPYDNVIIPSL